jgi:hypothetical protein
VYCFAGAFGYYVVDVFWLPRRILVDVPLRHSTIFTLYRVRPANFLFYVNIPIYKRKLACRTYTYQLNGSVGYIVTTLDIFVFVNHLKMAAKRGRNM